MSEHFWEFMFKELATVPGKDKEFNRAPKSVKGTGKTARTPSEPSQVVTQFSIISFNGIGLAFIGQGGVKARGINQCFVSSKGIRVILMGKWAAVKHGLHILTGALLHDIPAYNAVSGAVNIGQDEDFVFLSATKVNNSSSSLTSSVNSGTSGGWLGRLSAWAFIQLATV